MDIIQAITERKAIRAYRDEPVADETVHAILDTARHAPSGVNTQPWEVAVVRAATKKRIGDEVIQARERGIKENPDYQYYPEKWVEPFRSRRVRCGLAMYKALDIKKDDNEKRMAAWYRNYHFFGAPVGLLFFMDKAVAEGSFLDLGMFMQNIMLVSRHFGLETCPQASLAEYPDIVREILGIDINKRLICGMALGYADMEHPVNSYRLDRVPVEDFATWYD